MYFAQRFLLTKSGKILLDAKRVILVFATNHIKESLKILLNIKCGKHENQFTIPESFSQFEILKKKIRKGTLRPLERLFRNSQSILMI